MCIGSFASWIVAAPFKKLACGMCVPGRRGLVVALICLSAGMAEAQLIDAFTLPEAPEGGAFIFRVDALDPANITTLLDAGALGGNRGVYGQLPLPRPDPDPETRSASYRITDLQQFRVVNGTSTSVSAVLLYGFGALSDGDPAQEAAVQANDFASLPQHDLNQSYDPAGGFSFEYQNEGNVTDVQLRIVSGNGGQFSSTLFVLPQATFSATFVVPFASFALATPAAFSDIDQIVFRFGGIPASTVLTIDNLMVTAVPEPGSWALLGMAGLLGWGGVRWRRRRLRPCTSKMVQ